MCVQYATVLCFLVFICWLVCGYCHWNKFCFIFPGICRLIFVSLHCHRYGDWVEEVCVWLRFCTSWEWCG